MYLTHKIVKTPSDRNLYYLLFSFLLASFGTSENAFTIQEFEQNNVLLQPMFMPGEFSIFDLNNRLTHSSDWLLCPPQPKELSTVATINCGFLRFQNELLTAVTINCVFFFRFQNFKFSSNLY